jgi:hypothetical protein
MRRAATATVVDCLVFAFACAFVFAGRADGGGRWGLARRARRVDAVRGRRTQPPRGRFLGRGLRYPASCLQLGAMPSCRSLVAVLPRKLVILPLVKALQKRLRAEAAAEAPHEKARAC